MAKSPPRTGALSVEEKLAMILSTHEAARDMVDDLDHLREVLAKPLPTSGDHRRLSNLLRRLLIDNNGDLRKIAPPRLGRRVMLTVPDGKQFVQDAANRSLYFASLCATGIVGFDASHISIHYMGAPSVPPQETWQLFGYKDPEDRREVAVRVDGFLSQRVLYFAGQWISREQAIKYIANVARGVHFGDHKEPHHLVLHRIRQIASLRLKDGKPNLIINRGNIFAGARPIYVEDGGLDFVLLQMMASARALTASPDMVELERIIRSERVSYASRSQKPDE